MKLSNILFAILLGAVGFGAGWYLSQERVIQPAAAPVDPPIPLRQSRVVAQGRILPRRGLVNIYAPPNQRIQTILVNAGDRVEAGTELAQFSGQATLQLQSDLAESQGADARRELDQRILAAEGNTLLASSAVASARLQLRQVEQDDSLKTAQRQLDAAREKFTRMQQLASDPLTRLYVAQTNLDEQQLELDQAETQLRNAQRRQADTLEGARLNLEVAQKTEAQAKSVLTSLRQLREENRTLELSRSIAQSTKESAQLLAPISATVLKINGRPGEVMLQAPLMQLGDLSQLVCIAEVVDRLVPEVKLDQTVNITSPALANPLRGRVTEIGRMVGTGMLTEPNPLAAMDRKTVDVVITLDTADQEIAQSLINLQVTAEIEVGSSGREVVTGERIHAR